MEFITSSSPSRLAFKKNYLIQIYLATFFIIWIITFVSTTNRSNWFTENSLTALFLLLLILTYKRFKFSDFSYTLIFIYLLLHIYGAQYTYAENPFGFWLKDKFLLLRNPYDRIVHCSFGLLMTYPMRDYFANHFKWPGWVCWVLPVEITLSFSALYELLEWLVADIFYPAEGIAYLGTQGDIWDAQKDMGIAFTGAVAAMVIFKTLKWIIQKFTT